MTKLKRGQYGYHSFIFYYIYTTDVVAEHFFLLIVLNYLQKVPIRTYLIRFEGNQCRSQPAISSLSEMRIKHVEIQL